MGTEYTMNDNNVLERKRPPSENALRDALAVGLANVQGAKSDGDAADELGWSVGTIRNVRNRHNTASAKIISDGVHNAGGRLIAPWLALHGLKPVDIDAKAASCDRAKLSPAARIVSFIADATDPDSCGGTFISDEELIENAGAVAAAFGIMEELNNRLHTALTKGRG